MNTSCDYTVYAAPTAESIKDARTRLENVNFPSFKGASNPSKSGMVTLYYCSFYFAFIEIILCNNAAKIPGTDEYAIGIGIMT